ncbi:MAG TPA: asparagine synthase-related protein [Candidatus Dormibacteraeota bacterium]|nr:asparagine synthase-related protein [Candidatus Dormibacteraeota bacterium]
MLQPLSGIAGIIGRDARKVSSKLDATLSAMKSRGALTQSVTVDGKYGSVALGSCSHQLEHSPKVSVERTSFAVDGSLPANLELEEIGGQAGQKAFSDSIRDPGGFSVLGISGGRLLAGRDMLGQKPLYYGRDPQGTVAFASLKAALSKLGISNPRTVPPGHLLAASTKRVTVLARETLSRFKELKVGEDQAAARTGELLLESLAEGVPEGYVTAFSGGLDSTLVAYAARENELGPELITVGLKGQAELEHARRIAKELGLEITVRELSQSEIMDRLGEVVETVESTDSTLVGHSVPLFFVCEVAEEMGMEHLLVGQLSDELFAGYGRFEELALKHHILESKKEVLRSVLAAATNDFEPGDKLAVSHQLELQCPFAYLPLVHYALSIPISLKLRLTNNGVVRKYVLRRLAASWKLPESVVNRPKKAVQYSSGVQKVLLKEAKKRKMTLHDLLESFRSNS